MLYLVPRHTELACVELGCVFLMGTVFSSFEKCGWGREEGEE